MDNLERRYDEISAWWRGGAVYRPVYLFLIFFFAISSLLFGLNRGGLLPERLALMLPDSPYYAIQLAFTLVLLMEVSELILAVADSVALAMAKQLEIMSLIMLRDAFTDISLLHFPIDIGRDGVILLQIAAVALSGLLLFIFRALFSRVQYIQTYSKATKSYIRTKKCLASLLFMVILAIGLYDLHAMAVMKHPSIFFETFYTALIFSDILLLLIGQYFMPSFHITFRNSGYAVGTLLMRISLSAPHYVGAALCAISGAYVLALAWATARSWPAAGSKPPA